MDEAFTTALPANNQGVQPGVAYKHKSGAVVQIEAP
jgi:hypothetical protein